MIQVWILLTPTVFSVKFVFEKNENKQKEGGVGPFKKQREKVSEQNELESIALSFYNFHYF